MWNQRFDKALQENGTAKIRADPCLYVNKERDIYIIIYVDDALIAGPNDEIVDAFIAELETEFMIKNMGEPRRFLGYDIERNYTRRTIRISQREYAEKLINEAGLANATSDLIPMPPGWKPNEHGKPLQEAERHDILHLTGQSNWMGVKTRPDYVFALGRIQRCQAIANKTDMDAMKRIVRYIKGTMDYGITLNRNDSFFEVYVDSSHIDYEEAKSTRVYIFFFQGAPISWSSKRQTDNNYKLNWSIGIHCHSRGSCGGTVDKEDPTGTWTQG